MKRNVLKRIALFVVATATTVSFTITGFAAQTLYEQTTSEKVVKGVNYSNKYRLTDEGWLDIHIITVDLTNGNITVSPVLSQKDAGLRQTVSTLITDNGAVAGVNSAYFGMTGNYSAAFAPQIAEGEILSLDADKNIDKNQFGTYFVDSNGQSYFNYFKTTLDFYVDGQKRMDIAGMNTITEMKYPVYIDRSAMETTEKLDQRFKDVMKIVVEDDKIIKISEKGETVNIPANGFIIALGSEIAGTYEGKYSVGQRAILQVNTVFNVDDIETAISGGGIILKDGVKPENYGEMASGRHPRTLLGISQDGNTMKLIVVEGQRSGGASNSIGLNVDEAVALLKAEGMYNALNLDGGGSSLMALKTSDKDSVTSVSTPAELNERPVVAAVGVFDNSSIGDIQELVIKPSSQRVMVGSGVSFEVFGYDSNYHKIPIATENVNFSYNSDIGSITGNIFNGKSMGKAEISAQYGDMTAVTTIDVVDVASILPQNKSIGVAVGQSATVSVKGLTYDGYSVDLGNNVSYSSTIGSMNGNVFTADAEGVGYITCTYKGLTNYIKVTVGMKETQVSSFEDVKYLNFVSYPEGMEGIAGISTANVTDGGKALGLSYYFKQSTSTQAAYLEFPQAITIDGTATELKLDIKGNGSGQWVRGKLIDASGSEIIVDFSKDVNWTDWKTVTAQIPSNVTYPLSIKTIYVASLQNDNTNQQVMYFDNLRAQVPLDADIDLPDEIRILDEFSGDTKGKESGYTYYNFTGNVVGSSSNKELYTSARVTVNNALGQDSDYAVFAGTMDISAGNNAKVINRSDSYQVSEQDNVTLINMVAKYGGLRSTQKSQWTSFKADALNTKNKNVIIYIDKSPDSFTDSEEGKLFKSILKEVAQSGKNVFVLYTNTNTYSSVLQEGVRYISLPSLWNSNGTVNSDYKMIRFKASGEDITFETINVF